MNLRIVFVVKLQVLAMVGHKIVSYNQKPRSKVPLYVDTSKNQNP